MSFESEVARLYENGGRSWEAIPRKQLGRITKVIIIKDVRVVSFIFGFFSLDILFPLLLRGCQETTTNFKICFKVETSTQQMVVDKYKSMALIETWKQILFLKLIHFITVGETPARSACPTTRVQSAALIPPKTITPSSAFGPGLVFTHFWTN